MDYYFEEIPHGEGQQRTLHKVVLPDRNQPKHYTSVLALDAFRHGKRKGASEADKITSRHCCNWGPDSLYIGRDEIDMTESFAGTLRADATIKRLEKEHGKKSGDKGLIEGQYGIDATDWREIPTVNHDGIKAFFQHIGFDQKLRGYVDEKGQPRKYSVVQMTAEQMEKFKAAVKDAESRIKSRTSQPEIG